MKKISLLLALSLLICLCGCSKPANADQLETIKKNNKMIVAMEGCWSPWTYHDEVTDELVGYDVEVSKEIAKILGVEVEFVEADFGGLLAGMDSKRYDIVVNGIDVNEERKEKYDFSQPYIYGNTALIVRTDNEDIKSFEDLNGVSTCNSLGSSYAAVAEECGANVSIVPTLAETFELVIRGTCAATLNAEASYKEYMAAHPDAPLKIVYLETTDVAIPFRKGSESESFRLAVDDAIKQLRENGKLAELSIKYFGLDLTNK